MHCVTSLDEFTVGQRVLVVAGLGCYRRGLVGDITRTKVVVLYDDSDRVGFHRPDEIEAMGWIAGHDRQGRDHAEEMLVASAERDAAEGELERLRGALAALAIDLLEHTATTPGADDHEIVCEVESTIAHLIGAILRGAQ